MSRSLQLFLLGNSYLWVQKSRLLILFTNSMFSPEHVKTIIVSLKHDKIAVVLYRKISEFIYTYWKFLLQNPIATV